MAQVS